MDYRIVWSKAALADLRDLVRFIAVDDPLAARRFGDRIVSRVEGLQSFPRLGRMVPEFRDELVREIILTPYRIIYEVDDDEGVLSVLRVWHGARGEPELPPQ
jgi:plasmid stabilization system protein ParE